MKTELINGYLHEIIGDHSMGLESRTQEEQLSAEEYLASQGIPNNEILKLIIEAE